MTGAPGLDYDARISAAVRHKIMTLEDFLAWEVLQAGQVLDLPEVGVSVPLGELYDGVDTP